MDVVSGSTYIILLLASIYLYSTVCLMVTAQRLGAARTWMAWVPLLNIFYFLNLARSPGWWMLLVLIPFVNIAVATYSFMVIAEKRGRPAWWGLVFLFPPTGIMLQGALAFSEKGQRQRHVTVASTNV
jgi:hypothetical protein